MIMSVEHAEKLVRFCEKCGGQIPKSKWQSWKQYSTRKLCGRQCRHGRSAVSGNSKDLAISDYIALNSRNGRLMADFNLGVLKAVEKVGADVPLNIKGLLNKVICSYKGVPVTGDVVKTANQWLMDNWMGKAGQRNAPPEVDQRNADEKLKELEYVVKELGFKLVRVDE